MKISFRLIIGVLIWLSLSGCQHGKLTADDRKECPYNGAIDRASREHFDPESEPRPSKSPIVKVIEFTEEGELHDRCQWSDAIFEIRGGNQRIAKDKKSKFVVIYVHGWKHNAEESDSDLKNFTSWIKNMSDKGAENTDVVGIYVSWPGQSIPLPIFDNLTFWGRKGAADRVSIGGNFSKFLSAVENVRRQRKNDDDFIVGIGHSFGARILFSAASPIILHELQTHHPGERFGIYKPFKGVLDFTILLNPAFDAARYTAFDSTRRWQEKFHQRQQPILLSIATENDYATRFAFPLGQLIGTRWHEREKITLGNYTNYTTHEIKISSESKFSSEYEDNWYSHFCSNNVCLERTRADDRATSPFLVAKTNSSIIDGHNGIWGETIQSFVADFLRKIRQESRMVVSEKD